MSARARRQRDQSEQGTQSAADLFAGFMVSLLLILLVVWLEALNEAVQIRKLKQAYQIFVTAFADLGEENDDIQIDPARGEIIMKAQGAFQTGVWRFEPRGETRARFLRARQANLDRNHEQICRQEPEHMICVSASVSYSLYIQQEFPE